MSAGGDVSVATGAVEILQDMPNVVLGHPWPLARPVHHDWYERGIPEDKQNDFIWCFYCCLALLAHTN